MVGLKELPDANPKIIEARKRDPHEMVKDEAAVARGRRCAPPEFKNHPVQGNAAQQLNHAYSISRAVNSWAKLFKWSDDFCLMIDVANSQINALCFNITQPIRVKVHGPEFYLSADTVFEVNGHGEGWVKSASPEPTIVEPEPSKDPYAELRRRHPFAMESDLPSIMKMENVAKWDAARVNAREIIQKGLAKPVLPNAMVVRGGHDAVGWLRD